MSNNPADGSPVQIKLIFKRKHRMGENIHLYNVLFKRIMKILELVEFGRKHFDPSDPKIIPQHKLEIWPGYVTAGKLIFYLLYYLSVSNSITYFSIFS